jgi:hypothetical protein
MEQDVDERRGGAGRVAVNAGDFLGDILPGEVFMRSARTGALVDRRGVLSGSAAGIATGVLSSGAFLCIASVVEP